MDHFRIRLSSDFAASCFRFFVSTGGRAAGYGQTFSDSGLWNHFNHRSAGPAGWVWEESWTERTKDAMICHALVAGGKDPYIFSTDSTVSMWKNSYLIFTLILSYIFIMILWSHKVWIAAHHSTSQHCPGPQEQIAALLESICEKQLGKFAKKKSYPLVN